MYKFRHCCWFALVLCVTVLAACDTAAEEMTCGVYAVRISAEALAFPLVAGDLRAEGAIGCGALTLSGRADIAGSLSGDCVLGGEIRHTRGWIDLGVAADWAGCNPVLSLFSQTSLPAWLLAEGEFTLLASADMTIQLEFLRTPTQRIFLSPYLASVMMPGDVTVRPIVGIDIAIDSAFPVPQLERTYLTSTVDAGAVIVSNTVAFDGVFESFRSLDSTLSLLNLRLRTSVSMIASGGGGFVYRIGLSYEWGTTDLLPKPMGQSGQLCAGDVCF